MLYILHQLTVLSNWYDVPAPSAVAIEWFRSLLLVSKQTILTQPLQYQAGQEEYFNKET